MSILVLGGAGYIGSHTVCALCEAGYDVAVVDNLVTGHRASLRPQARFYEGDIGDAAFLRQVFLKEKVEAVIHFAAFSQVGESVKKPLAYYENNLVKTRTMLEEMVKAGIKHIVFSSTAAVYGEPKEVPITEDAPTQPENPYGETKLAMERMFHWTAQAEGITYVSLRYFNACGAHAEGKIGEDHDPETHLIPLVLEAASGKREKISIFGTDYPTKDGTCIRDYIHVSDLAQAHILAVKYLLGGGKSEVFNLGNGTGFSVREIVEAAREVTGRPILAQEAERRAGDPAVLIASSQKAKEILGWEPKYTKIQEMIQTAWVWHQHHPHGFDGR